MKAEIKVNVEVAIAHGLTASEYEKILEILERVPNLTELGIFAAMWSEHCSYKSTRIHLGKLPTKGECVICGPGENAGVIDIGDNQVAIFKMESHNHPSYIEPYQGAATGVGGIMRDVFTMGARPIANLNALRFGALDHPKTKYLLAGVVAGIGGYGNAVGVPTVGGECNFHKSYDGNILVNAMNVGITTQDKVFYSKASVVGSAVVYVGSKTGRDGIHGAVMASAEFDDEAKSKRPTVQVGDPFTEKLLIEACLELMAIDAILGIQDMGAAGLTSSSLEMAGKGGTGIELNLSKVPVREEHMTPYEMMLSESQERMLVVLRPEKVTEAENIFKKWNLDFAVIGTITATGRAIGLFDGQVAFDLPIEPLSSHAPMYDRPFVPTPSRTIIDNNSLNIDQSKVNDALLKLISCGDLCSKRWIYEQYDSSILANTVRGPGANAAVVRVSDTKALALTSDCTARYCYQDPVEGGKQAVAESWRNLTSVGATPLAITNCLNFGNPERPEIMGQLVGCIEGIAMACAALNYPVVSGNVSLYNETSGQGIYPTPSIGGVGLINDVSKTMINHFASAEDIILMVGHNNGHLGASLYLREILGQEEGSPPSVDLAIEKQNGDFVRQLIQAQAITACTDISDGGLYIAIAEMAMASNIGASLQITADNLTAYLFGEDQARYIITCKPKHLDDIQAKALAANIELTQVGTTITNPTLVVNNQYNIDILTVKNAHENTLPHLMA